MLSLRFRGLEDGGRGGKGLFILVTGDCFWSDGKEFRSEGGAFSLADLCFLGGFDLAELGFGEDVAEDDGSFSLKIALLGSMKCFIACTS